MKYITIKLLEGNTGEDLCDLGLGKDSLDMTPKAQSIKAKLIHWISSKVKTSTL